MAFDLATARSRLQAVLQDDAKFLTATERDIHIDMSVEQVNHDRPRVVVTDIAGDGTQNYIMPASFQKGFSNLRSVEMPAGETPPRFRVREDDWFPDEDPSKPAGEQLRLRFKLTTPKTTETIRVTLTTPYVLAPTSTVDTQSVFLGIIYKSAVNCFRALAARFAQTTDPSIAADSVDYGGRSQNFLFLAERYENNYKAVIGLAEQTKAAMVLREIDVVFDHGEDYLMHPARTR